MSRENNATLRQGLKKFYEENRDQLSHAKKDLPADVKSFFKSHDIAHVLFDCDISLYGEGSVKIWTIFGTTLGFWNHFKEYKKANAFDLAKSFSLGHIFSNSFKLIFSVPSLIVKAKRMNKKWPWNDFEHYLDSPLDEIRKEFNIRVLN